MPGNLCRELTQIQTQDKPSFGARVGAFVVGVIFLVGLFVLARAGWTAVVGLHFSFQPVAIAQGLWGWFMWFLHDQAAIWITALATLALWRATWLLTRATNIEHASQGPFLHVNVGVDQAPPTPERIQQYFTPWAQEDAAQTFLAPRAKGLRPRFVAIHIENMQQSPHGVASNIKATATLFFGAPDDVAPHPYSVTRTVGPVMILAGRYAEGPLFNVAGLQNWMVAVTKVEYEDIMKRPRSAAAGTAGLHCPVSGNITSLPRVFEPRKGEYTDAD